MGSQGRPTKLLKRRRAGEVEKVAYCRTISVPTSQVLTHQYHLTVHVNCMSRHLFISGTDAVVKDPYMFEDPNNGVWLRYMHQVNNGFAKNIVLKLNRSPTTSTDKPHARSFYSRSSFIVLQWRVVLRNELPETECYCRSRERVIDSLIRVLICIAPDHENHPIKLI